MNSRLLKCICDCGSETITRASALRVGLAKSCGCLHMEIVSKLLRGKPSRNPSKGPGREAQHSCYASYRHSAGKRNIEFGITEEEFGDITIRGCCYCGSPPSQQSRWKNRGQLRSVFTYNGIDRSDHDRGYVVDNCLPCCKRCNFDKTNYSLSECREWSERVYEHGRREGH